MQVGKRLPEHQRFNYVELKRDILETLMDFFQLNEEEHRIRNHTYVEGLLDDLVEILAWHQTCVGKRFKTVVPFRKYFVEICGVLNFLISDVCHVEPQEIEEEDYLDLWDEFQGVFDEIEFGDPFDYFEVKVDHRRRTVYFVHLGDWRIKLYDEQEEKGTYTDVHRITLNLDAYRRINRRNSR